MSDGPQAQREKNRQPIFRLWLITAASLFLVLLTFTQFLPGGTRTCSDWLSPLFFLFAVSLATPAGLIAIWLVVRPPCRNGKLKGMACALAGVMILLAVKELWATWRAWDSRAN